MLKNIQGGLDGFICAHVVSLRELFDTFTNEHNGVMNKSDFNNIKTAFGIILQLFPNSDTTSFSTTELLHFQKHLTAMNYARSYINKLVKFVRSVFKWGVIHGIVPAAVAYSLTLIPAVRFQKARENEPRTAVYRRDIEAVLPHLPPTVADMVRLQLLTAMRPGEVCNMTAGEIKRDYDGEKLDLYADKA